MKSPEEIRLERLREEYSKKVKERGKKQKKETEKTVVEPKEPDKKK